MVMNGDSLGESQGWGKKSLCIEDIDSTFGINELGDVDVAGGGGKPAGVVAGECGEMRSARVGAVEEVADGHFGAVLLSSLKPMAM